MKVESIKIKNFKAIEDESISMSGNNVYLIGPNGSGKSSFIDAIFKTISGKDIPSKVTNDKAKAGSVEIDLGEYVIKASFSSNKEKIALIVENKDGARFPSPRTMLDKLAGVVDFDINTFFNLRPKEQVEFIKKLVGIDFTDLDEYHKEVYEERTYVNKKVKELEQKQITFNKSKTEPIDIKEIQTQLKEAVTHNAKVKDVQARFYEREEKIAKVEDELAELKSQQSKAAVWLDVNEEISVDELQHEFDKALKHNEEVENTSAGLKLLAELNEHVKNQEHLNKKLAEIEATKKRTISEAKLPVDGLTFDDDQLYLNGLPFEKNQINTAQLIIAGLKINLALLKDIKIARFDGSLLDSTNMKVVEKWAKENDLQLFVELVERDSEGLRIEVKEGYCE